MARKLSTSPKGTAVWPKLDRPDTKFDKAGVYTTRLSLDPELETTTALQQEVDTAMEESYQEAVAAEQARVAEANKKLVASGKKGTVKAKAIKRADAPYKTDDETGNIVFSFKMKASGERKDGTKFNRRPVLFDAKGKPVKGLQVGGGSTIRVSYHLSKFYTVLVGAGVSLQLEAVQVIDLKTYSERNAEGYGFGQEDGYDASEEPGNVDGGDMPETDSDDPGMDEPAGDDDFDLDF